MVDSSFHFPNRPSSPESGLLVHNVARAESRPGGVERPGGQRAPRWDYLFVFSNVPAPRAADRVREAVRHGRRPLVIYFRRPWTPLHAEEIPGADVIVRDVRFRDTEPKRLRDVVQLARWLRREVFQTAVSAPADSYADSLDCLAAVIFAARGRVTRVRFEVRDLHELQLSRKPDGWLVRGLEKLLLPRVHVLILTSDAFYDHYYRTRYSGRVVTVENWPDADPWKGFVRRADDEFTVGWVGVVRYLRCLRPLVAAVRRLRDEGLRVRLRVAGGGAVEEVRAMAAGSDAVEVVGPFRYDTEIQDIYSDVDLIYAVYDTSYENVRLAMPNKFYEAQLAGIPMVVASGTYLERRVRDAGIGASVPCDDEAAITQRIREAVRGADWYRTAARVLGGADIGALQRTQEAALTSAVME